MSGQVNFAWLLEVFSPGVQLLFLALLRFSPWCVHLLPHSVVLPLSDVLHAVLCKVDIQAVK